METYIPLIIKIGVRLPRVNERNKDYYKSVNRVRLFETKVEK